MNSVSNARTPSHRALNGASVTCRDPNLGAIQRILMKSGVEQPRLGAFLTGGGGAVPAARGPARRERTSLGDASVAAVRRPPDRRKEVYVRFACAPPRLLCGQMSHFTRVCSSCWLLVVGCWLWPRNRGEAR